MKINNIQTIKYTQTPLSFRSSREHEAMLRAQREAEAEEMKRRFARLNELHDYKIQDQGCHKMAQFLLNFVCSIENDSEHSLDEFFDSEIEAAKLRQNLTPECQRNSLEMRAEIQSQPVFKDPALTLITAKDMKDYVPVDEEFSNSKEFHATIEAAKKCVVTAVKTADKTKFDKTEIGLINELTQIIEKTKGIDFGAEYDKTLEKLLASIKARKQKLDQAIIQQKVISPKQIIKKLKF